MSGSLGCIANMIPYLWVTLLNHRCLLHAFSQRNADLIRQIAEMISFDFVVKPQAMLMNNPIIKINKRYSEGAQYLNSNA